MHARAAAGVSDSGPVGVPRVLVAAVPVDDHDLAEPAAQAAADVRVGLLRLGQVTMGMHGIVFVKPDPARLGGGATQAAYGIDDGDSTGDTRYTREFAIMLSEVDTRAHFNDAHIQATDWTDFHADIWTMNGRAYPDTLEPNGFRNADGDLQPQSVDADQVTLHRVIQLLSEVELARELPPERDGATDVARALLNALAPWSHLRCRATMHGLFQRGLGTFCVELLGELPIRRACSCRDLVQQRGAVRHGLAEAFDVMKIGETRAIEPARP